MRRTLLTFVAIATISITSLGQLQDFDTGVFPPVSPYEILIPEWSGGTQSGDPATWYRSDDPVVNGFTGNIGLDEGYGGTGKCAILYSNRYEGYNSNFEVDMILNSIDMSSNTTPFMSFYIKHPDGTEKIEIGVSNMGGAYDLIQTINSNYSDWTRIFIDLAAYGGSNDVSIRFRGTGTSLYNSKKTNVGIDNILIGEQTYMSYISSTTTQPGCGLKQGYDDQEIMRIDVETQGTLNPLEITKFLMNTNGTTDECNDVTLKKIYYTGIDSVFNSSNLVGTSDLTGDFTISASVSLVEGTNYFWVACDVPSTSTASNVVDVECTELVISGSTKTPTITAPAGDFVINNTGVFMVTNTNTTGSGSLRSAIESANAYTGCGPAIVDATGVTGTITWGAELSCVPEKDVIIIGSGAGQLTIKGAAEEFLYQHGKGSLTIKHLKVTGFMNGTGSPSVIYMPKGTDFTIENCIIDANGIQFLYFPNDDGNVYIRNCTFSNNFNADGLLYCPTDGSIEIYNSTFYNNSSDEYASVLFTNTSSSNLILENCTFKNNSCSQATPLRGAIRFTGGINGTCTAINTTFDNNTPLDFDGNITMNYSHMSNTTGATITGANNVLDVSGDLSALADNGGITETCAINAGSPLIDAGTANLEYDQRGYCRSNTSDIGAFEYDGVHDVIAPVPAVADLPDLKYCLPGGVYSLPYPTATDNCASNVNVSHNLCLPLTSAGTTVVTWTYDDGNGNTTTQDQNVVITSIDNGITKLNPSTIMADVSGYNYQWIDCDNANTPIWGATDRTFVATKNGSYAVQIDNGTCTVTSACTQLTVGLVENDFGAALVVYPNPTSGDLKIDLGEVYDKVAVIVYNAQGQIVLNEKFNGSSYLELKIEGAPGNYIVDIQTRNGKSAKVNVIKK